MTSFVFFFTASDREKEEKIFGTSCERQNYGEEDDRIEAVSTFTNSTTTVFQHT